MTIKWIPSAVSSRILSTRSSFAVNLKHLHHSFLSSTQFTCSSHWSQLLSRWKHRERFLQPAPFDYTQFRIIKLPINIIDHNYSSGSQQLHTLFVVDGVAFLEMRRCYYTLRIRYLISVNESKSVSSGFPGIEQRIWTMWWHLFDLSFVHTKCFDPRRKSILASNSGALDIQNGHPDLCKGSLRNN